MSDGEPDLSTPQTCVEGHARPLDPGRSPIYFLCVDGQEVQQSCPAGLVAFPDPNTGGIYCDTPH